MCVEEVSDLPVREPQRRVRITLWVTGPRALFLRLSLPFQIVSVLRP